MEGTAATEDCKDTGGPLLLLALGDDDEGAIVGFGFVFKFLFLILLILVVRKWDVRWNDDSFRIACTCSLALGSCNTTNRVSFLPLLFRSVERMQMK